MTIPRAELWFRLAASTFAIAAPASAPAILGISVETLAAVSGSYLFFVGFLTAIAAIVYECTMSRRDRLGAILSYGSATLATTGFLTAAIAT